MLVVIVALALTAGCKALEKEVDYASMTGGIPENSPLQVLGSGKY